MDKLYTKPQNSKSVHMPWSLDVARLVLSSFRGLNDGAQFLPLALGLSALGERRLEPRQWGSCETASIIRTCCVSISFLGAAFEKGNQAAKIRVDEFHGGSKSQKVEHCVDAVAHEEEEEKGVEGNQDHD